MILRLLAVGTKSPAWVQTGFQEYARRMPPECRLELVEITPSRHGEARDAARAMRDEAQRLQTQFRRQARVVVLDERGKPWTSRDLSQQLGHWLQDGRPVELLIGGADGLDPALRESAEARWSLSPLTLPHMLVRVLVAEALYRAHTILKNHPYHRA